MKRLFSYVAVLLISFSVISVSSVAEAKKFGGGRSFGSVFKTAPAPKKATTNTFNSNKSSTAARSSNKRGLMGGILGGLLAGGLLAAFFGGAFDGIQFLDILILGLVAYFIFKFLRGMLGAKQASMNQQQPAFGNMDRDPHVQSHVHNFEQSDSPSGGFGAAAHSDVPHNYPNGFDKAAFIEGAREHYRILQGAWNYNQLDTIKEYVSESLFNDLRDERAKLDGEQHTDVMYVDAEIVRADYDQNRAHLSIQFSGRYRDAVEGIEENIEDVWHLERDLTAADAPWIIIGIQG
ncbi:Tim44 domain-containing protein [Vibrio salinus]|uniref:Tim44 domain-containing protein n=1 Tax=Vibrio salinus TaxID=2899784 RepID=UPI001E28E70C|nr:TIM44-like domain-containing protein [Vibrio salinus]MCE0494680.1 TIM44-like domain-containing protein [Vibrio salinus]